MNILIVLAGEVDINIGKFIFKNDIDYILAVDGGYNHLIRENIKPNLLIGDLDSVDKLGDFDILTLKKEKDYTDYEHALEYVKKKLNFKKIFVLGFLSLKRPEHFYANLKNIKENIEYVSKTTTIKLFLPGEYIVTKKKYVSFFAHENVDGLTLESFKYELDDYNLKVNDTLCISNEVKKRGKFSFKKGKLIAFFSEE